jgi:hypothetical protein
MERLPRSRGVAHGLARNRGLAMTQREKVLAGAVAASAVLWVGMGALERYRTAVSRNENIAAKASTELDDAEFAVMRGEKAKRRLIEWSKRSLPTEPEVAKSLYQDWVRKELARAGLTIESLTDRAVNRRTKHYGELSLEAKTSGTLEQLTNFLYKFYAAPHLHRISTTTITPSENGAKLAVVLGVDALILPESDRKNELAKGDEQKLPHTQEAFKTSLTGRNVFAPHTPAADPGATQASAARISMIVSDGEGSYHLWIRVDSPEKTHKFEVGDKVEFGSFSGELVEIDLEHVVFKTKDGRYEVRRGQNLGEVKKIEEEAASDDGDNNGDDESSETEEDEAAEKTPGEKSDGDQTED